MRPEPRLGRFVLLRHHSFHAVAEFEDGLWFVLVWVGLWATSEVVRQNWGDRLKGLTHRAKYDWFIDQPPLESTPSAWVIVAEDI